MKVHEFDSTWEAYAACQCDETVHDGDVLVIRSERVVGVAETWPVAVTAEYGGLHQLHPRSCPQYWAELADKSVLLSGWKAACAKAVGLGYPLWEAAS